MFLLIMIESFRQMGRGAMRSVAIFLECMLLPACAANASGVRLLNESLKDSYDRDESVTLEVVNDGKAPVAFYSNAEILDDGEWITWPYEIEHDTPEGVSVVHRVKVRGKVKIALNFVAISPPPLPEGVTPRCGRAPYFRFRVVVDGKVKQELFSNQFKVVDPYRACSEDGVFKSAPHP